MLTPITEKFTFSPCAILQLKITVPKEAICGLQEIDATGANRCVKGQFSAGK